jgi:ABC-type branched-subunit amino acid transport system substrate-binding protein
VSNQHRWVTLLVAAVALNSSPAWAQESGKGEADSIAIGRRIYREGILPSGQSLQGLAPANVTVTGKDAACATCHRRSGYGASEGRVDIRAITGPALFGSRVAPLAPGSAPAAEIAPAQAGVNGAEAARANAVALRAARTAAFAGTRVRPAYDEVSLARAIREGVDVTGQRMNASMPRFALEPAALEALSAYLKTLSAEVSPGVTEDAVHFATVIQPGTDSAQRRALLDVLQAFIQDRNLGMRTELRREQAGMVRLRRIYREWVLHVWDLSGSSDTWDRQLEAYYRAQPVFAMVSGLGHASWRPIHEFSERLEVPCIFPQADVPKLADRDFYTVYLSRGMALEAQALAKFLQDEGERGPVVQVFRSDESSVAGAEAFRKAWTTSANSAVVDRVIEQTPDEAFWRQLALQSPGATLVLWLPQQDLTRAQALTAPSSPIKVVYLSASLTAGRRTDLAADGGGRVRLLYPQDLPAVREARLHVVKRWLQKSGIELSDEKLQMNAYLAVTVTGMAVSHSMDTYSREFLVERLEHRIGTANELSIYPHLSLGPGQRYASKGSYVVQVGGVDDLQLKLISDWIVP